MTDNSHDLKKPCARFATVIDLSCIVSSVIETTTKIGRETLENLIIVTASTFLIVILSLDSSHVASEATL